MSNRILDHETNTTNKTNHLKYIFNVINMCANHKTSIF